MVEPENRFMNKTMFALDKRKCFFTLDEERVAIKEPTFFSGSGLHLLPTSWVGAAYNFFFFNYKITVSVILFILLLTYMQWNWGGVEVAK